MLAGAVSAMAAVEAAPLPWTVKAAAWALYWVFTGAVGTGVWVVAHECGHQAFSDYKAINDGVGLVLVRVGGGGAPPGVCGSLPLQHSCSPPHPPAALVPDGAIPLVGDFAREAPRQHVLC